MENNELSIKQVNVFALIQILTELYDKGVDFVNIHGTNDENQDSIEFSFSKEYMDEEYKATFDEFDVEFNKELGEDNNIKVKLSDKDLDELI